MPLSNPTPRSHLPRTQKLGYGFGGFISGFSLNAPNYLANPIYNLALGLNPVLIGVVIALSRFWDGVTDPLFGHLSDNARTRWGRRKPFMLLGAILLGVAFALMWWIPRGAGQDFYFWWFLVTTLLFYTASSTFLAPWSALGIEMTSDYNERTNLNGYVGVCYKAVGMSYAWLFPLAQLAVFQDTIAGVRYVGLFCGTLLTLFALVPVFAVKEKPLAAAVAARRTREPFFASMKAVCSNPVFLKVSAVSVLTMTSLMTVSSLALYINIYHVFGGDKVAAAKMAAYFGMWFNILSMLSIPFVTWLGRRIGKHRAIMACLGAISVSAVLKFFAYTPAAPWAQMLIPLLHAPGLAAYLVLINSMTADLVDHDEFRTGHRREALLAAANHWLTKMGMSLSYIAAGLILSLTGFDAARLTQDPDTVLRMRICFCTVPATGTLLALLLLRGYPLSKARLEEIQATLARRRLDSTSDNTAGVAGESLPSAPCGRES